MPGMEVITAANMLSELETSTDFPKANKQAKLAGICPINFLRRKKKGRDMCRSRETDCCSLFYFLAIRMIQISTNGTPRNKVFQEYYLKRVAEGKNKQQALICIARRLVNIV